MRSGSSKPGPAPSAGSPDGETPRTVQGCDRVGRPQLNDPASPPAQAPADTVPSHPPTEVVPPQALPEVVRHGPGVPTVSAVQAGQAPGHARQAGGPPDVFRYGPGVPAIPPAGQAELTAERIWRAGGPVRPPRGWTRLRRLSGWALTVILLVACAVVLYLRVHHAPFRVSRVAISQQTRNGCGVDVTGRIATNGAAGTVSYQWLFRSDRQSPRPLSQSVDDGQHAVYVTVAVQGQGHGSASQTVTLQVLGPDPGAASAVVVVSCP